MSRPGVEEGIEMNEDVQREFTHVREGQERIEESIRETAASLKEQSKNLSDHFRAFRDHLYDDKQLKASLDAHIDEHTQSKKHRWVIISGIVLTAVSAIGMLLVEIVKAIWLKG